MPPSSKRRSKNRKGSLLIDALLATAIFGVLILAFSSGIMQGQLGTVEGSNRIRALYLAEEGLEAVRYVRDKVDGSGDNIGYAELFALATGTDHGVKLESGVWTMKPSEPTLIDGVFTRKIIFTAGSDDNERLVQSVVTWEGVKGLGGQQVYSTSILTNWQVDPPPPPPDWNTPSVVSNIGSSDNLAKIEIVGDTAYIVGMDQNQDGFYEYDVSNYTIGAMDSADVTGAAEYRAYDIEINGDYAYVATSKLAAPKDQKIQILDITQPDITCCAGTLTLSGDGAARGLAIEGDKLYVVRAASSTAGSDEFARFDIAGVNATAPVADGVVNDDTLSMYDVTINGNYAYIAADDPGEITTIDISTFPDPTLAGGRDLTNQAVAAQSYSIAYLNGTFMGTQGIAPNPYQVYSFDTRNEPGGDPELDGASPPWPNPQSDLYDLAGNGSFKSAFDIDVNSDENLGLLATDKRDPPNANPAISQAERFFVVIDFSDVNDIEGKTIYNGPILRDEGYLSLPATKKAYGIAYRDSDHTAYLVVGKYETMVPGAGDFFIFRPEFSF